MFLAEASTDTSAASFQSPFRPLIRDATADPALSSSKDTIEGGVQADLQTEVSALFNEFQNYTDEFTGFQAQITFSWEKAGCSNPRAAAPSPIVVAAQAVLVRNQPVAQVTTELRARINPILSAP